MCACTERFEAPIPILHVLLYKIPISSSHFFSFSASVAVEEVYGGARTRWYCCDRLGWLISESPDACRAQWAALEVRDLRFLF